jgi:hypothetical protein
VAQWLCAQWTVLDNEWSITSRLFRLWPVSRVKKLRLDGIHVQTLAEFSIDTNAGKQLSETAKDV